MPYIVAFIQQANQIFDPPGEWDPEALLEALDGVDSVLEAIDRFGLFDAIEYENYQEVAREFVELLPPSLDAAILAVVRSALSRGLKTQFTWKPAYAFELDLWESARPEPGRKDWVGLVNVLIMSPDPVEEYDAEYDSEYDASSEAAS